MNVEDLMTTAVKSCGPDDSLEFAARLMWENDFGSVPVVRADRGVVAMVTDRDICMAAYTQGGSLGDLKVRSAMSAALHSVGPLDPISKAERLMQECQVRRVPVIDAGRLVGVLSLNDIARLASRERLKKSRAVTSDDVALTLASVSRPRSAPLPAGSDHPLALVAVPAGATPGAVARNPGGHEAPPDRSNRQRGDARASPR